MKDIVLSTCLHCISRQDMTKDLNAYWDPNLKRKYHSNWQKDPGCQHEPLFTIPLDHVVVDELHLMLRIIDRLEDGLVYEMLDWDEVK